jgi:hypothetical protein
MIRCVAATRAFTVIRPRVGGVIDYHDIIRQWELLDSILESKWCIEFAD